MSEMRSTSGRGGVEFPKADVVYDPYFRRRSGAFGYESILLDNRVWSSGDVGEVE